MTQTLYIEIETLLSTLYTLQSSTGADTTAPTKPKPTSGKKTDRFLEIKTGMIQRLTSIQSMMMESREREGELDPKDVIRGQSQIREEVRYIYIYTERERERKEMKENA